MERYQRYTKYLQVKRTMNIPERATKEQTEAITQPANKKSRLK